MKNRTVIKIISCLVLLALCAGTVAGIWLGIWGRTTEYADIQTESGTEHLPLNRQVAFIPNTINQNWQEAIRPEAKLAGGYRYTFAVAGADADGLKDAADVLTRRAELLAGNAYAEVAEDAVVITVPEATANPTLAAVLSPQGICDFVLYNNTDGSISDPVLTAADVDQAYYSTTSSATQVQVRFTKKGAAAYNELRTANASSRLYLRLDGQNAAYASLTALNDNMLSFTVSDNVTAYVLVSSLRSGALPGAATLTDSERAVSQDKSINTLILVCAAMLVIVAIGLMLIGRAGGLAGVWAAVGWVILFCLLTALIAVDGNWIMTSLSMTCLVICFFLFLYGLVTLYGEMGKQIKAGRGVKAAYADACRSKIKFLAILYGVVLLIGLVLMVAFKAGMYGILGRIVAVSALLSFVVLFVCIRVVLGCWSAVTAKN